MWGVRAQRPEHLLQHVASLQRGRDREITGLAEGHPWKCSTEGFMLSLRALFLAVLYHRLIWRCSISPSTTTDIYCPQSSSLNTPLGFRWREHPQQQVIEDWEQFSFTSPSWDLNHQLPDPTPASLTIKVGVVLVGCGAQTISQSTENVTIWILPSLFCFLFK